jgi:hypothetical protein
MAVAPVPIIPLLFFLHLLVLPVLLVPLFQIMPIGTIFALIPVVIVLVSRVVHSHLNILRFRRRSHHRTRGRKCRREDESAKASPCYMHRCFLQAAIHAPRSELRHSIELNDVVLIAEVMRRETYHNLLLHNRAARSFFREYSAPCKLFSGLLYLKYGDAREFTATKCRELGLPLYSGLGITKGRKPQV